MLKAGFRKCHRRPQHRLPLGCEPRGSLCCEITGSALSVAGKNKRLWCASWFCKVHTGRVRELKNGHNSVTVQNRTRVYMNFFHHKDLGNHLLQLCSKVVKHPVYIYTHTYSSQCRKRRWSLKRNGTAVNATWHFGHTCHMFVIRALSQQNAQTCPVDIYIIVSNLILLRVSLQIRWANLVWLYRYSGTAIFINFWMMCVL
jgi:hypothetical protein